MLTGAEDIIVLSHSHSIPCTTSHKTCQQLPYNKRHPNIRVPLNARSMGSARQTGHTPHGRTSRSFIQKARGQYCFISLTQDTMHYLTQNTPPNPTIKGTHIRVPFGQDLWVWPDNPAYPPPQPHLRYPLTSTDEDPNKRFVRQSCSRAQRTLLFYLTHTEYHEGYLFEVVPSCTTKNTLK